MYVSQDARELQSLDASRGAALLTEIANHRARTVRADRKLARDVAKWVDSALSGIQKPSDADIDVVADNEDEVVVEVENRHEVSARYGKEQDTDTKK